MTVIHCEKTDCKHAGKRQPGVCLCKEVYLSANAGCMNYDPREEVEDDSK